MTLKLKLIYYNMKRQIFYLIMFIIGMIIGLTSCRNSNVDLRVNDEELDAHKFEFEGNHYITFEFTNRHGGGVSLDPSYIFKGDTINYGGEKYVKVNK